MGAVGGGTGAASQNQTARAQSGATDEARCEEQDSADFSAEVEEAPGCPTARVAVLMNKDVEFISEAACCAAPC